LSAAPPLSRSGTFRHGVHPPERKDATEHLAIERVPFVEELTLPLSQHIGAPSKPVVEVGQRVRRGQLIAKPGGFVSVGLHAPVTGTIAAIERRMHPNGQMMPSIVVRTDPYASQRVGAPTGFDLADLSPEEAIKRVQLGGLVGQGGAAFPTHVKLAVPEGRKVRFVVINGCECEPYLTCDHRTMVERPEAVVRGTQIIMSAVGAERGYIGVEMNKPDAIEILRQVVPDGIEVVPVQVKYPQGAEKMLIDSIFKKEIPQGGLPIDLEMLVNNVGTAAAMADLFDQGVPFIERVVTVTGPAIVRPRNVLVPIGTPLSSVLAHCGGLTSDARHVILGGPMMGQAQKSLDAPVLKGTSGVLCLDRHSVVPRTEYPCIRCGRCAEACPMFLNPARLARFARGERVEELKAQHIWSCFECASCSYVCPSGIPLVHWMRIGKAVVKNQKVAE